MNFLIPHLPPLQDFWVVAGPDFDKKIEKSFTFKISALYALMYMHFMHTHNFKCPPEPLWMSTHPQKNYIESELLPEFESI